jgi:hypothetical protein
MSCKIESPCAIYGGQIVALTLLASVFGSVLILMSLPIAARLASGAISMVWLLFAIFLVGWLASGWVTVFLIALPEYRPAAIVSLCLQLVVALALPIKITFAMAEIDESNK